MSVPNQKIIEIHKPDITPPFLQVSETDWQEAFKTLTRCGFGLYLYLSQNTNGYKFEFSPQAIANLGLMAKGTATKARQELEEKGYIVDNIFYVESLEKRKRRFEINSQIDRS